MLVSNLNLLIFVVMSRSWRKKKIEEDKYRKICEFFTIWQVYLFDSKLTMAIFI